MAKWLNVILGSVIAVAGMMSDQLASYVMAHPNATLVFAGIYGVLSQIAKSPLYQTPTLDK